MIADLKPYSKYQESKLPVAWAQIPSHWHRVAPAHAQRLLMTKSPGQQSL